MSIKTINTTTAAATTTTTTENGYNVNQLEQQTTKKKMEKKEKKTQGSKKKNWKKVDGYDTNLVYGLEDWEFWISILKNNDKVKKLEYIGFYYRIKEVSMLSNLQNERLVAMQNIIFYKHYDFFVHYQGGYHENLKKNQNLTIESKKLRKLYESRLFRLLNKLL